MVEGKVPAETASGHRKDPCPVLFVILFVGTEYQQIVLTLQVVFAITSIDCALCCGLCGCIVF